MQSRMQSRYHVGDNDALTRGPAVVHKDVIEGWMGRERARGTYGVAIDDAGQVDDVAAVTLRNGRFAPILHVVSTAGEGG